VVCVLRGVHATQHTHTHNLTHMLPQYCANYNDVILLIVSTKKSNFGQAQYRLPDDGLYGPKHVGVTVKKCFNVNFNI
jgi:hypothetical protein